MQDRTDRDHMAIELRRGYKLTVLLSLAGFLSGLITICADYPVGPGLQLFLGIPLGVLVSAGLRIVRGELNAWTVAKFTLVTGIAYPLSGLLAGAFQFWFLPLPPCSVGPCMGQSLAAIFLGGAIGGFLVIGAGMYLFESTTKWRALSVAFLCSPIGGALGVFGWALASSLGVALWSFVHALYLTAPTETIQNAAGETSHVIALTVVWQTGMAFVLGVLLWRYEAKLRSRELEQP